MPDLAYPIGKLVAPASFSGAEREVLIQQIEAAPARLRQAVQGLTDEQLSTPYRPGGWNVRQVVHHVPDSHMNAYIRVRLALTEDEPTVKPYREERWAELPDSRTAPIEMSLTLLEALHRRFVLVLRNIQGKDWERTYMHPDNGLTSLNKALADYAWHGRHHVAHITSLRERSGWI